MYDSIVSIYLDHSLNIQQKQNEAAALNSVDSGLPEHTFIFFFTGKSRSLPAPNTM